MRLHNGLGGRSAEPDDFGGRRHTGGGLHTMPLTISQVNDYYSDEIAQFC